jgi:hypothetical protein
VIWVYGHDDDGVLAFTDDGIEYLMIGQFRQNAKMLSPRLAL